VAALLPVPLYLSTATTAMWCWPLARLNDFASWSFHFWYRLTPSIQTSSRLIPDGELPLARKTNSDVVVLPGVQILLVMDAEGGGAQLAKPFVARPTRMSPPSSSPNTTSWRESRFRS